jgi:hypothetical protein
MFPSDPSLTPLPSTSSPPIQRSRLAVIVTDDKAIQSLIELVLDRSGLTQSEIARRLGIKLQSLNEYYRGRRRRPSVQWLARLIDVCGAKIYVEFPSRPMNGQN